MPVVSRLAPAEPQGFRDSVFDAIPFPIYVADVSTFKIVSINKAMQVKTRAAVGDICHLAIYHQQSPCSFCKIGTLTQTGGKIPPAIVCDHFNDRDKHWYQLHESSLIWFDGRTVLHSVAVDIDRLKDAQNELSEAYALLALKTAELERASVTDALTELFNRRKLDQALQDETERASRYNTPLSLIILDIDHFKIINDTHGHQVGDQVLQAIARILHHKVRSVDIVGRWGGEEFLIICPDTSREGATHLAELLRSLIEAFAFPIGIRNTSSFGVAEFRSGETVRDLVARTDAALYRAKIRGRNRVENDARMSDPV